MSPWSAALRASTYRARVSPVVTKFAYVNGGRARWPVRTSPTRREKRPCPLGNAQRREGRQTVLSGGALPFSGLRGIGGPELVDAARG